MLKQELLDYLENQTAFIDLSAIDEIFTAKKLAELFQVKRNTISHYLNQLNEEQQLVKINSRPVVYFHKEAFEKQFFAIKQAFYSSVEEIQKEQPLFGQEQELFSLLIGHDKSLSPIIEQIKTALYYPDNGLPVLINGESGTGKSYLVKLIHQYCLQKELINESAPLITLNCAQYANNPELLSSNLFGHVAGAYTGASTDKKGAFEAADGGILFLDEVHRLNAEGQEKLFTYLDQGVIYRMGDTNQPLPVKTRLFFATTEELTSSFLTTFIRRIPIKIELPSLSERSRNERLELIYSFFIHEQKKINRPLHISGQVLNLLASQNFSGNIGELKNSVKVTAARAFSMQKDRPEIEVTIHHLQEYLLKLSHTSVQLPGPQQITITENSSLERLMEKNQPEQRRILTCFERILVEYKKSGCQIQPCEEKIKQEVIQLFDFLLFETGRQQKQELLVYLTQYVRETLKQMESAYQIKFDGNSVYAISYYLYQRGSIKWQPEELAIAQMVKQLDRQVSETYASSYHYVTRILELCKPKLDLEVSLIDKILLTLYLRKSSWTREARIPKAIVAAHGYATASSMANVANRLLGKDIFESFDMPLDVTPEDIAGEILDYSENNDISNGLVILVDMGSLKEIYQFFPKQLSAPIAIMNNVSTPAVLACGELLQEKRSLDEILTALVEQTKTEWELIYPKENKTKALITTCFTGIGTATHISSLLEKSLPATSDLEILPYDYDTLRNKKSSEPVFSMYDVLGIIGTANPTIEAVDYLSLEELISESAPMILDDWLDPIMTTEEKKVFNSNLIRNFSLEKVIDSVTILDTEKVMKEIDLFMRELENKSETAITNPKKVSLYVHVSCLIERLIRNMPIETYLGYETLYQCQKERLQWIKQSFSVIEEHYSVKIPESEIAYIYDILFKTADMIGVEEDF